MSIWNQGVFDATFSNNSAPTGGSQEPNGKLSQLTLVLTGVLLLFYPFTFVGLIPFGGLYWMSWKEKKQHLGRREYVPFFERFLRVSSLIYGSSFVLNLLLALALNPRAYLSCYNLFPLNFLPTKLPFTLGSFVVLLLGGLTQCAFLCVVVGFVSKRSVRSMDEEFTKLRNSREYQERKERKFEVAKEEQRRFKEEQEQLKELENDENHSHRDRRKKKIDANHSGDLLVGVDEFGHRMTMDFSELNQHATFSGTTGSGKTTLNMIFVDYAIAHNIPVLYIDGKGAKDTLESIQTIAKKYDKQVKVFSDTNNVRYNPIKHGNSVMVRDRLITLAETESVFYSGAAKSLIQATVQFLDLFEIDRTLHQLSEHFLPRNVLMQFLNAQLAIKEDLLFMAVEEKEEKKKKKATKKKENDDSESDEDQRKKNRLEELDVDAETSIEPVGETLIEINPEHLPLEELYYLIRRFRYLLPEKQKEMFKKLFMRYEHKDNPFYLYATSEALQTNVNMLIDSELGHLFDTSEKGVEELDLLKDSKNNEVMFLTLNGLVYKDYIKTLAQFFVTEVNYLASENYIYSNFEPFLLICDEPSVYLNDSFLDAVNKGRGAGLHTIFSPQMLADIDRIDPILTRQLVGNCNTYFIGQVNSGEEIDTWTSLIGTYNDIEKTSMVEQEYGYSDLEKTDWISSRGTVRNVRNFIVHPDELRDVRQGEFIVYRKSKSIREQASRVYVVNAANR
ncbi:TraM recognition domain-containing protein (plasmid) [Enterococcus mundtii]|uniref:TraM recognition domain-containing protein n=1 Tax=Enterococcus mundtii TaxID=53346 RepID=UPI00403C3829